MLTPPDGLRIQSLDPTDVDQRQEMGSLAFAASPGFDPTTPTTPPERTVAAYDGDRVVGTVVTLEMTQTWGGRQVQCGGLAGVIVRPEYRGRNVARPLVAESFDRMATRDEVISALFPTTATLYRSMGYEIVGWHRRRRLLLTHLPRPSESVTWRQVAIDDPGIVAQYQSMAAHYDGWVSPGSGFWAVRHHRLRNETTVNRFAFIGTRDGRDVAAVRYRYTDSDTDLFDVTIELLGGVDGDAITDALAFVGGHGTTGGAVTTEVPTDALAPSLAHLQRGTPVDDWPWMLRLVDAPGAVAARGVPTTVSGTVALDLTDHVRPANAGAFVLGIDGGQSELQPGGAGTVACSISTLAALYGGADPGVLARAGALPGATEADLDVFRAAWMTTATNPTFF